MSEPEMTEHNESCVNRTRFGGGHERCQCLCHDELTQYIDARRIVLSAAVRDPYTDLDGDRDAQRWVAADSDAPTPREATLREALDAMADTLNVLDGVLDDTHPEGHDCDLCRVMDEVPKRWLAVIDAARLQAAASTAAAGEGATEGLANARYSSQRTHGFHDHEGNDCPEYVVGACVLGIDVEALALATARVVGLDTADDYHRDWAAKVASEYAPLIEAAIRSSRATSETPRETPLAAAGIDVERLLAARLTVEAGYILQPDRTKRAYWEKVAAAYDLLAARGSE